LLLVYVQDSLFSFLLPPPFPFIHVPIQSFISIHAATNYLSAALMHSFDTLDEYLRFPSQQLFEPLGMHSALIETDSQGLFIASSFAWMTARDWGRMGLLYANDGMWDKRRILPEEWVALSRTPTPTSGNIYGMHFWLGGLNATGKNAPLNNRNAECDAIYPERIKNRDVLRKAFPKGTMLMKGFEDQVVAIHPESQTVVVRLGATKPMVIQWEQEQFYTELYQCLNVRSS
jgi:CubicO group peptidase (beta-lactamase class C family)